MRALILNINICLKEKFISKITKIQNNKLISQLILEISIRIFMIKMMKHQKNILDKSGINNQKIKIIIRKNKMYINFNLVLNCK